MKAYQKVISPPKRKKSSKKRNGMQKKIAMEGVVDRYKVGYTRHRR